MHVKSLKINGLRNIEQLTTSFSSSFNLIFGENGSGKSSVLESLYLLMMGRSFRTNTLNQLVQFDQKELAVHADFCDNRGFAIPVGIKKGKNAKFVGKINGEIVKSSAELVSFCPTQLINQDSYLLLTDTPKIRRQFIDWGVFHVEPGFLDLWRRYHRCLQQRNAILKKGGISKEKIRPWNRLLAELTVDLEKNRQAYLFQYQKSLDYVLAELDFTGITLEYKSGRDESKAYEEVLEESFFSDLQRGFTQFGAHRSDIKILHRGVLAKEVLSRGQQKTVVAAMRLAQGELLSGLTDKHCIYLVDDLPAELDEAKRQKVVDLLGKLKTQVFITGVLEDDMSRLRCSGEIKMFHMKQGCLDAVNVSVSAEPA